MSKSNVLEDDILNLLFNATAIANLADNTATSPATSITVALHTASPGEAGNMTTNEAAYTGYSRVTVVRTSGGWSVSSGSCSPVANIEFPQATGGSEIITHMSLGTGVANNVMYYGTVTPNVAVSNGVTPRLTTASTITED